MSSQSNHPRGLCIHVECQQAVAGCAAFVVFVNDTLREVSVDLSALAIFRRSPQLLSRPA